MSKSATKLRVESGTGDIELPVPDDPTEALFREARRRRRRRRSALVGVVLLVVGACIAGWVLSRGSDSKGPPSVTTIHNPKSPPPLTRSRQGGVSAVPLQYSPAQSMGLADSSLSWVTTGDTLEITLDGGSTWRTITPPNLQGVSVSEDVTAVDAIGTEDIWVVITDVPGLVPYPNNGSSRGEGIDESTDGGKSWMFVALPGCLQNCGPLSLSMVDTQVGYAVTDGFDGARGLGFSTHDGGATWIQVSTVPNLNGVEVGGAIEQSQLLFNSELDGWAVPGTRFDPSDNSQIPGGLIYRTTNGGLSWSPVPGLPTGQQYTAPEFFSTESAVTLATKVSESSPTVYVTEDGGSTWTSHALPAFLGSQFSPGGVATRFAAVGLLIWKIDVGSQLYETNDGGVTWTTVKPMPTVRVGNVMAITFSSPNDGIALGIQPSCPTPSAMSQAAYCGQVLTVTTDGGRHWSPAKL